MSNMEASVQSFLDFISSAFNTRDVSMVYPGLVTSDCSIQLVPAAFLKRSGLPPNFTLTHQQWIGHLTKQFPAVASSKMETLEKVIDEKNKKAVVRVLLDVTLVDDRTHSLEYVIFLYFREESGETKINKIVEFVDGEAAGPFQGMVQELVAKLESKGT
jgi:hypothetical protein